MLKIMSPWDTNADLHIHSWLLHISLSHSPGFAPDPHWQHFYLLLCLLYVQVLYLSFQPKLVAQYEPKINIAMVLTNMIHYKKDGVNLGRQASFLHKEKTVVHSQISKPNGEELSYFSSVWANHHQAACRLLSPE